MEDVGVEVLNSGEDRWMNPASRILWGMETRSSPALIYHIRRTGNQCGLASSSRATSVVIVSPLGRHLQASILAFLDGRSKIPHQLDFLVVGESDDGLGRSRINCERHEESQDVMNEVMVMELAADDTMELIVYSSN